MLSVHFQGGVGNQLFQLAAAETIAKQTARNFVLLSGITPTTHHSKENYFNSILSHWKQYIHTENTAFFDVHEKIPYQVENWNLRIPNNNPKLKFGIHNFGVRLVGFFQNYNYISDDFCSKLTFDTSLLTKYPNYKESAFLHIRGGDYINNWFHDVKLDNYYQRAIKIFPSNTHFYIFTNDVKYAKTKQFLKNINHTFINENEINSLYLMSQCGIGGICANSSFSWWGAYLNKNRILTLPSKWYNKNTVHTEGYYFPGCHRISV